MLKGEEKLAELAMVLLKTTNVTVTKQATSKRRGFPSTRHNNLSTTSKLIFIQCLIHFFKGLTQAKTMELAEDYFQIYLQALEQQHQPEEQLPLVPAVIAKQLRVYLLQPL